MRMDFLLQNESFNFATSPKECTCPACFEARCYKRAYSRRFREHMTQGYRKQMRRNNSRNGLWRPWTEDDCGSKTQSKNYELELQKLGYPYAAIESPPQFQHPVKLVWPKKPLDYMYAQGEQLLKDFPIQATLEFASESDTDSEDEYDDDDYDDQTEQQRESEVTRSKETRNYSLN